MEEFIHGMGRTTTDICGSEQMDFQKKVKKKEKF